MDVHEKLLIKARDIERETRIDPKLSEIKKFVFHAWPERINDEKLRPYFKIKTELTTYF